MDAVMMAGMIRVLGEDGGDAFLDVIVILLGPYIAVEREYMKGLSFDIIGEFLGKGLISLDARGFPFFGVRFLQVGGHGIDPEPFAITNLFAAFHGFFDQRLGAGTVVGICHRHAPISHGMAGMNLENLTKGAFGLEIPESMQLADALVEKNLRLGGIGGDGKGNIAGGAHQIGGLPRAFIEGFTMVGMPRWRSGGIVFVNGFFRGGAAPAY